MNGGYVMVDATGIDLLAESSKTVAGIYNKFLKALQSGKPIIAYGISYSTAVSSPIAVNVKPGNNSVTVLTGVYSVAISNANAVVVTDLTASTENANAESNSTKTTKSTK